MNNINIVNTTCTKCKEVKCEYDEICCKCNDYDYISACRTCTIKNNDTLRDPILSSELENSFKKSMESADALRSGRRKSAPVSMPRKIVPKLDLELPPQHSQEFLIRWSQSSYSPRSPHIQSPHIQSPHSQNSSPYTSPHNKSLNRSQSDSASDAEVSGE